jgi:hypothetical protein
LQGSEESLESKEEPYFFDFNLTIAAAPGQKISYVSTPADVQTCEKEQGALFEISIEKSNKPPKRDLRVFYRTDNMMSPSLLVEESEEFPDQVAVASVFCPTFKPKEPQEQIEVVEEETPEYSLISNPEDFHFVFLVDRSGSMSGSFINTAK